ncbi:peptidoglycan D,D-transpeptidase FtsI family protein [Lutispora saccharofermentans]|uniref:Penicillin-binding protein 2 n=1 Tax=Lutispora saccharofermentans TaxID=3024236 RepID=A0ABT1NEV3_9FIRM|nr:penicillin-binding protein 2 [Lutispora saccharofermentans]MCQ1529795.1 penicillin-binding protein 2 [Lutispora saccharofermentans]
MPDHEISLGSKKRILLIGILFIILCIALLARLFFIQIIKNKEYSKKAVQQRMMSISLGADRGNIYDRNLIPFTGREIHKYIIVYPAYIQDRDTAVSIISKLSGLSRDAVAKKINSNADALEFLYENRDDELLSFIESGKLKGVIAIEKNQRYSVESIGRHVIGYISKSDKKGEMGIEKSMDNYLSAVTGKSIIAVVDSSKNIIPGLGFRKVEASSQGINYGIKLTLDYHIQNIVEEIMDKNDINGAIVVMDIKTGDILAMASHPDYEQDNIQKYINSNGEELINKAIWPYDLGSVFKIVVAAAAIESGKINLDQKYICEGSIAVGNSVINCSTHKSHENREITIDEAFALSCNTTFVKIGMELGAETILNMARKLGLGEKQCYEILEEKAGYIPNSQEEGIGNISIGQGKIQVTPLQVTAMMASIANNGIKYDARLIDELINEDGGTVKKIDKGSPRIVLSPTTAYRLKRMLRDVAVYGTGKQANIEKFGGSSGKTGTAETGMKNGNIIHGWFTGFIPSNDPQYAITVFINNGRSGGGSAAPIFKQVGENILTNIKR